MPTGLLVSNFRERFNELFNESNKTNTSLGKELHVSNQTVSAWKLGTRSPKEPTVIAIAECFGVDVRWLMGFDVEKKAVRRSSPIIIPDSQMFQKVISHMSVEDFETVMGIYEKTYKKMIESGEIE